MTTLKELFLSRACKVGLAVMLAASMVPVAALSTAPAFAEDADAEQVESTGETTSGEPIYQAGSGDEADAGSGIEADDADDASATAERETYAAESDEDEPAGEGIEAYEGDADDLIGVAGEGIEGEAGTEEGAEGEEAEDPENELSLSAFQLESLETTVEEPFSIFAPFRLLFGAASDTFTVPLKQGNYAKWIDRLDLSNAPYARDFYDILVEAADNDGVRDWLIDDDGFIPARCTWIKNSAPTENGVVGNVYRFNSASSGILAAIVDDPEAATAGDDLTDTEKIVKKYIGETYGAFDRDYPSSFWRDVSFGIVFARDKAAKKTLCFFALASGSFDLRAQGYRMTNRTNMIRPAIEDIDAKAAAIAKEFEDSNVANKDTDYARVKFYNQWLCDHNVYNSDFMSLKGQALADFQAKNPDVWSAMSALSGRSGNTGPVCEGYSRAMQLLCQKAGIDCVVVDGTTYAGPHMWNYVRMGSKWYALDITWNDGSGPNETYLLVGSNSGFLNSHPVSNQFVAEGTKFTNGPVLSAENYDPNSVTFAGVITSTDSFAYGDSFALEYNANTEGDVTYEKVSGPASISTSNTAAEAAAHGSSTMLTLTGVGNVTVKVTFTPKNGGAARTDTMTITAGPRPLKVSGTELASKVYDGTNTAIVKTAGRLETARPGVSYASAGVLQGDVVELNAKNAYYDDVSAGTQRTGSATYELAGNADTLKLYTLGNSTDYTATGSITKRPVTAYFALTSTRMLLDEEKPRGTVRYEEFTTTPTARGLVAGDDMVPTNLDMKLVGMPTTLAEGKYQITWAKPNAYVLTAINELPAAANYDVALAEGAEDEEVTLEVVDLKNTVVVPVEGSQGGQTYRVEARMNGINDDTVSKLTEANSGFTSVEGITAKLLDVLKSQAGGDLTSDRVAVYDMVLYVKNDKGAWEKATADNFPSSGVRITLAYPAGTAGNTHSFYAAHMFTSEVTSGGDLHKPGDVETPEVLNGQSGPNFILMGFSPVSVAWKEAPQGTQGASSSSGTSTGNGFGQSGATTSQVGQSTANQAGAANGSSSNVSQTGDSLPVVGLGVVALVCVALIAFLLVRRNRNDKKEDGSADVKE